MGSVLTQLGRYQIVRKLGQGAMGAVWLARDPVMGREVAIKSILHAATVGEEARTRFEREAKAAGALNHPNVVTIHELGEDQGQLYLVMEYVKGEDLEALIKVRGLTKAEALEVLAQVCDALFEAHALGIIHRDIKPANVRVFREGHRVSAKVMDFGVASLVNSDLTSDGTWMGTLSYMAPEYLDSGKAGPRSDLFAVGVMLFEAMTGGRKPFPGDTPSAVLNRLLLHPPETLANGDLEGISPYVTQILHKVLSKQGESRYASADELSRDLRAAKNPDWLGYLAPRPSESAEAEELEPETGPSWTDDSGEPSDVLIVSGSGQGHCLSLAAALRRAVAGTRIFVMPGVYRETLEVTKAVEIIGNGNPADIVLASDEGPCLTLRTPHALIANLTLKAGTPSAEGLGFAAVEVSEGEVHLEDCECASASGSGVVVQGEGTQVHLRRVKISGCLADGLQVQFGATAMLERCQIAEVGGAGLRVANGARATLQQCRLHRAQDAGAVVEAGGSARFEECNFYRHVGSGVRVVGETRSHFLRCQFHDDEGVGVELGIGGKGLFEDCDIFANRGSNVSLGRDSDPTFRQCKIHDGREYGILSAEGGTGTFEGCEIFGNRLSGLVVSHGSNPHFMSCVFSSGMGFGVQVTDQGRGLVEQCEIRDHVMAGAKISRGGSPIFRTCQFTHGRDVGLHFAEGSRGIVDHCQIRGNARGGIRIAVDAEPLIQGGKITDPIQRDGKLGLFGL